MALPAVEDLNSDKPTLAVKSASAYAVDIVGLSKSFKRRTLGKGSYTTVKSALLNIFSNSRPETQYTHAIKDLTLRIPRGASVGLIGRNGSGKSTFLKLVTGIYKPDKGTISVNGRLAALIELGAGFHPDFTGRENLYLGGVMHGMTRAEIDDRFDEIVHFAELENVIDDPVRTYSSGMFMRLGFSLAVHTNPDVLLVDEVLAVGDAAFVAKCKERLAVLRREGKTLLLVTHDLDAVYRWCDEVLWLNNGTVCERGEPRRVIDRYLQYVEKGEEAELEADNLHENDNESVSKSDNSTDDSVTHAEQTRWGSREIEILRARLVASDGDTRFLFHPEDSVTIEIDYKIHTDENFDRSDVVFGIALNRTDGLVVHGSNTDIERVEVPELKRAGTVHYKVKRLGILDGTYTIDLAVHKKDGYPYDYHKGIIKFAVRWPVKYVGVGLPEHTWSFS